MELWVFITIFAAFFQTVRTALQKHLKVDLSTNAISFARFFYGFPWALAYIVFLIKSLNLPVPETDVGFWIYCFVAGIAQIISTSLLVYLFSFKNFMIGTTYVKTEAIQTAILGVIFFQEAINLWGFFAVLVGILGIMLISIAHAQINAQSLIKGITQKEALIGLCAGGGLALASLCLRQASLSLESESFLLQAAMTLVCTLFIQSTLMGIYLALKERDQWPKMLKQWRKTGLVGLTSVLGSGGWFTAFTLTTAAYVKTVGQIEIIFTILISIFIFKENIKKHEYFGMALIILSILILIYN
jgi:drug/metabolite transporter (DMT)-like permease